MSEKFTTSKGVTVGFLPIAGMVEKLNSEFIRRQPELPYYEVKLMGGAVERHAHDETTVSTDEEKAALAKYKADKQNLEAERAKRATQLFFLYGLDVEMPGDDAWIKKQEFVGIQVPNDPYERKIHWIATEVVGTLEDLEQIKLGVQRASGVPEENLQQAEDSFRHPVGQREGAAAGGTASTDDGASVVVQPEVRAGDSRIQYGQVPKRVRRGKS